MSWWNILHKQLLISFDTKYNLLKIYIMTYLVNVIKYILYTIPMSITTIVYSFVIHKRKHTYLFVCELLFFIYICKYQKVFVSLHPKFT